MSAPAALLDRLAGAASALAGLPRSTLAEAWQGAVGELRDAGSPARRELAEPLARAARLSPAGLDAALETLLGGVAGEEARRVFARGEALGPSADRSPILVVLPGNVPGLAVQPLLPALARRRPVLLKSPSAEPHFAAAVVAALGREPRLAAALAATTWRGGDRALEDAVFARVGSVVAYGGGPAIADLRVRLGGRLIAFGPRLSLAVVGRGGDDEAVAAGLARDVALFDQRGCLSVHAVFVEGDAEALATALAAALRRLAGELPPGEPTPDEAAGVRELRDEATLRGLFAPPLPFRAGTVVVEPEPVLAPSPGLRAVRLHPVADLDAVPALLAPWRGQIQGVALAGDDVFRLEPALRALGVSRISEAGRLQQAGADWRNGGVDLVEALG